MVHLRLVVPPGLVRRVRDLLTAWPVVFNVVHLEGASLKPRGDVILCDVAREDASVVIAELRDLGLGEQGSISIEEVQTSISEAAVLAEQAAKGSPADAVVWEQVESRTSESAELSFSFLAFMVLATLIAAVGIMTDSQILIIGAMVVGPEFGPLAGLAVAVVERRLESRPALVHRPRGRFPGRDRGQLCPHDRAARARPCAGRANGTGSPGDALHLESEHVLGHRRAAGRHHRRPLADDGEVRRTDRSPHLGNDDSGGG